MDYILSAEQIKSITDHELARGTTRLLPEMPQIPREFVNGNVYTRMTEAMYYGEPIPEADVSFNEGFPEDEDFNDALHKCIMAHLNSFDPGLVRKIAGVGFMLSKVITITE